MKQPARSFASALQDESPPVLLDSMNLTGANEIDFVNKFISNPSRQLKIPHLPIEF
jgi:hypothetical protein